MRTTKKVPESKPKPQKKSKPPVTAEARENEMIALAVDLAEQQLRDGTASAQVITHYLKLGTKKEQAELEKIRIDNELSKAKIESLKSSQRMEELYSEAIEAMKRYGGNRSD